MIKTLGRVLLGGIIKNEQVQFFDLQMCLQLCYVMLCYVMLCYGMWNLFTVGSLQFRDDSAIASLEANQNRPIILTL